MASQTLAGRGDSKASGEDHDQGVYIVFFCLKFNSIPQSLSFGPKRRRCWEIHPRLAEHIEQDASQSAGDGEHLGQDVLWDPHPQKAR